MYSFHQEENSSESERDQSSSSLYTFTSPNFTSSSIQLNQMTLDEDTYRSIEPMFQQPADYLSSSSLDSQSYWKSQSSVKSVELQSLPNLFDSFQEIVRPSEANLKYNGENLFLSTKPIYIERLSSFYSAASAELVYSSIVRSLGSYPTEFTLSPSKGKIDCMSFAPNTVHFVIRLYTCDDSLTCVELQRRCGCSYAFTSIYALLLQKWRQEDIVDYSEVTLNKLSNSNESGQSIFNPTSETSTLAVDASGLSDLFIMVTDGDVSTQRDSLQCLAQSTFDSAVAAQLESLICRKLNAISESDRDPLQSCLLSSLIAKYCTSDPEYYLNALNQSFLLLVKSLKDCKDNVSCLSRLYDRANLRHLLFALKAIHAKDKTILSSSPQVKENLRLFKRDCRDANLKALVEEVSVKLWNTAISA